LPENDRQVIVEVVRDTARKMTDGIELLRLAQRVLSPFRLGNVNVHDHGTSPASARGGSSNAPEPSLLLGSVAGIVDREALLRSREYITQSRADGSRLLRLIALALRRGPVARSQIVVADAIVGPNQPVGSTETAPGFIDGDDGAVGIEQRHMLRQRVEDGRLLVRRLAHRGVLPLLLGQVAQDSGKEAAARQGPFRDGQKGREDAAVSPACLHLATGADNPPLTGASIPLKI
jgi:hypothetical protein